MKICFLKPPTFLLFIVTLLFCISSCKKSEDKKKEEKIKKEILTYQGLDADQIIKVYHSKEIESFERSIKDKCKLLDITITSFYTTGQDKKYSFLYAKSYHLNIEGEYKSLEDFVLHLKTKNKFNGIKELIIDSEQTGWHKASILIEILIKDYFDKDYMPSVVSSMVGISRNSEDILMANLKVYQSRYRLVKNLTGAELVGWKNCFIGLRKIPEKCFIKRLQYLRTPAEEQLKLDVVTENKPESVKKTTHYFETSADFRGGIKRFSQRAKPEELSTGLAGLTFIYEK